MSDELTGLVRQIDESLKTESELNPAAFVVLMTDTPEAEVDHLKSIAKRDELQKVPLTIYRSSSGPEDYHIDADYDVTVTMWIDGEVASNLAFQQARLSDGDVQDVMDSFHELVGP